MPHFLDAMAPTKSQQSRGLLGFIIFQSDYAVSLETVLVIPCKAAAANVDLGKLTPFFELNGIQALAMVPQIAGLARREVEAPVIGTALPIRDSLIAALDLLVTGF